MNSGRRSESYYRALKVKQDLAVLKAESRRSAYRYRHLELVPLLTHVIPGAPHFLEVQITAAAHQEIQKLITVPVV
jgi:hypothetical protein